MNLKFKLQFFGGGGMETTQIPKRSAEPDELKNLRLGLYNKIYPGLQSFDTDSWTQAQETTKNALNTQSTLLNQLPNTLNQSNALLNDLMNVVKTGNIPSTLTDTMNASVNTNLQNSMGNMLNGLSNRGVLNSSVTSQGVDRLSNAAANAYNQNYMNAYQTVLSGYGNTLNNSQNNTSALLSAMNVAGNIPSQTNEALSAQLMPAYNLWNRWQNSYDSREDYDTIVQEGK